MLGRDLELAWASAEEREAIRALAAQARRQILNMSRPSARIVRLREGDRLAGWVGLDVDHDPDVPELFSLYVEPGLRGAGAGRCLRLVTALFFEERGVRRVYGRISRTHDVGAAAAWAPFTRTLSTRELPDGFADACRACNLFEQECRERSFIEFDVAAYRAHSAKGLPDDVVEGARQLAVHGRPLRLAGSTLEPVLGADQQEARGARAGARDLVRGAEHEAE